jgi:glycosyltransferase involved in cell wall biosynthesis
VTSAAAPVRALFVNSGILGHRSVARLLREAMAREPRIEATHVDLSEGLTTGERIVRRLMCAGPASGAAFPGAALTLPRFRHELHAGVLAERRIRALERRGAAFDALHFHTQATAYASLGRMRRTPSVVSIDATQRLASQEAASSLARLDYAPNAARDRRVFRAAAAIVSTSRWAADDLAADLPECADRIHVMPYPVPLDGFETTWIEERFARAAGGAPALDPDRSSEDRSRRVDDADRSMDDLDRRIDDANRSAGDVDQSSGDLYQSSELHRPADDLDRSRDFHRSSKSDLPNPDPDPDRPVRVLFIGGDFPRKGGGELLAAWREGGFASVARLTLVTDWPIGAAELPAGVEVRRGVAAYTAAWFALWREADLFVMPTRGEAFGMVFQEAAAAGLPAVGTRINAIPEIVSDGETGILVPPRDPRAIGDAMRRLIASPDLRRRMGRAARRRMERTASIDTYSNRLADLMVRLAQRGARG